MPLRSRAFLAAGVIAVLASFALVRSKPPAPSGGALPNTALASASAASDFATPASAAVASATEAARAVSSEAEFSALLRAGRFDALLRRGAALSDTAARARWLDTCARLAPSPLLAEHALALPAGPERARLLSAAIDRWALDEPAALGQWAVQHLDASPELDLALARIVESTDALHRPTSSALAWARELPDPALRLRALRHVVREWASHDRASALRFAETTDAVDAAGRHELLALLRSPITET